MDKMISKSIGDRLKKLIERHSKDSEYITKCISREEILDETCLKEATLNAYLHDTRRPKLETLIQFSKLFNTTVDYIIGESDYPFDVYDTDYINDLNSLYLERISKYLNYHNIELLENVDPFIFVFLTKNRIEINNCPAKIRQIEVISKIIDKMFELDFSTKNYEELNHLLNKIQEYQTSEFSFKTLNKLLELDEIEDIDDSNLIEVIETYLMKNIEMNNKIMKILGNIDKKEINICEGNSSNE